MKVKVLNIVLFSLLLFFSFILKLIKLFFTLIYQPGVRYDVGEL